MGLNAIAAACVASPFLKMFGIVLGASLLAKQASVAATKLQRGEGDAKFLLAKTATAAFFAEEILPQAHALHAAVVQSSSGARLYAMSEEQFAS